MMSAKVRLPRPRARRPERPRPFLVSDLGGVVDGDVDVSKSATIIFRKFYSKVGFVPVIVNWGMARQLDAAVGQDDQRKPQAEQNEFKNAYLNLDFCS